MLLKFFYKSTKTVKVNLYTMWSVIRNNSFKAPFKRFYSQAPANSTHAKRSKFDKTMIKPALVVIIFGSVLTNVTEQKQKYFELERRYSLKKDILNNLIKRVNKNDIAFQIDDELSLVNKLFNKYDQSKQTEINTSLTDIYNSSSDEQFSESRILYNLNGNNIKGKEEDLDDLWKIILEDMNKDPDEIKHVDIDIKDLESDGNIITDRNFLSDEAKREKQRSIYEPKTDVHVIVENPGELSTAASDTKISKFL